MVRQVMRMEHNRQTKSKMAIVGWRENLEEIEKYPERKPSSIGKKTHQGSRTELGGYRSVDR